MAEIDNIISLLEQGARAEGLRQKAIASNIANLATPGYRRSDVRFEDLLSRVLDAGEMVSPDAVEPELYRPGVTPVKENGNDVSLEYEIGEMVKNSIRHKTYLRLLANKYAQMQAAIETRT